MHTKSHIHLGMYSYIRDWYRAIHTFFVFLRFHRNNLGVRCNFNTAFQKFDEKERTNNRYENCSCTEKHKF